MKEAPNELADLMDELNTTADLAEDNDKAHQEELERLRVQLEQDAERAQQEAQIAKKGKEISLAKAAEEVVRMASGNRGLNLTTGRAMEQHRKRTGYVGMPEEYKLTVENRTKEGGERKPANVTELEKDIKKDDSAYTSLEATVNKVRNLLKGETSDTLTKGEKMLEKLKINLDNKKSHLVALRKEHEKVAEGRKEQWKDYGQKQSEAARSPLDFAVDEVLKSQLDPKGEPLFTREELSVAARQEKLKRDTEAIKEYEEKFEAIQQAKINEVNKELTDARKNLNPPLDEWISELQGGGTGTFVETFNEKKQGIEKIRGELFIPLYPGQTKKREEKIAGMERELKDLRGQPLEFLKTSQQNLSQFLSKMNAYSAEITEMPIRPFDAFDMTTQEKEEATQEVRLLQSGGEKNWWLKYSNKTKQNEMLAKTQRLAALRNEIETEVYSKQKTLEKLVEDKLKLPSESAK